MLLLLLPPEKLFHTLITLGTLLVNNHKDLLIG